MFKEVSGTEHALEVGDYFLHGPREHPRVSVVLSATKGKRSTYYRFSQVSDPGANISWSEASPVDYIAKGHPDDLLEVKRRFFEACRAEENELVRRRRAVADAERTLLARRREIDIAELVEKIGKQSINRLYLSRVPEPSRNPM